MYPEELVKPMRQELTAVGFRELKTADDVDTVMKDSSGTLLVVFNSVCGCAAGNARPGIRLALKNKTKPTLLATVFAGQDQEATARARSYVKGYPPSSPSVALFKQGKLVYMMERHQIEGHHPQMIAEGLIEAFNTHCA